MRRRLKEFVLGKALAPKIVEIGEPNDVRPWLYWIEDRPIRFLLPTSMLRMQGAFHFGRGHPFVRALESGPAALISFYESFKPSNLAEMYQTEKKGLRGETLPPWELPWAMRADRTPPPGEAGLSSAHGVSFYGPASCDKVVAEIDRLEAIAASIRSRGYDPDRYGDIEGHFICSRSELCFFVRGGKHRAAVLAFLGHERIPVRIKSTWPRVVDSIAADDWPLVVNGMMDVSLARQILDAYLKGRNFAN